jgi:hypothetical protein
VFPCESTTELIVAVELFHPTTTTFKFPAVCASVYTTATDVGELCGVALLACTKPMAARACPRPSESSKKLKQRERPSKNRSVDDGERRELISMTHPLRGMT